MTGTRFAGLPGVMRGEGQAAASMREPATTDETTTTPLPQEEETETAESGEEEEQMPDPKKPADAGGDKPETEAKALDQGAQQQAIDTAVSAVRAEERTRVAEVFASDDVKGREQAAASMLADSDMAADKIIAMLPKLGAQAGETEGQQMLAQMKESANPDTGLSGGEGAEATAGENPLLAIADKLAADAKR